VRGCVDWVRDLLKGLDFKFPLTWSVGMWWRGCVDSLGGLIGGGIGTYSIWIGCVDWVRDLLKGSPGLDFKFPLTWRIKLSGLGSGVGMWCGCRRA